MVHAGSNVKLSISSKCLALKSHDKDEVIAMHDMPRISFASGGDAVSNFNYVIEFVVCGLCETREHCVVLLFYNTYTYTIAAGNLGFCRVRRQRLEQLAGVFRVGVRRRSGSRRDHHYRASFRPAVQAVPRAVHGTVSAISS